jgi:hypothetical protein
MLSIAEIILFFNVNMAAFAGNAFAILHQYHQSLFCVMLGNFGLSVLISSPFSYGHVTGLLQNLLWHLYLILIS